MCFKFFITSLKVILASIIASSLLFLYINKISPKVTAAIFRLKRKTSCVLVITKRFQILKKYFKGYVVNVNGMCTWTHSKALKEKFYDEILEVNHIYILHSHEKVNDLLLDENL